MDKCEVRAIYKLFLIKSHAGTQDTKVDGKTVSVWNLRKLILFL